MASDLGSVFDEFAKTITISNTAYRALVAEPDLALELESGGFNSAGTFTVNGVPHRLGAGEILAVPPGTRHSWQPDPGSTLVAVQIYDPPGPEQRFVGLAKAAARSSEKR